MIVNIAHFWVSWTAYPALTLPNSELRSLNTGVHRFFRKSRRPFKILVPAGRYEGSTIPRTSNYWTPLYKILTLGLPGARDLCAAGLETTAFLSFVSPGHSRWYSYCCTLRPKIVLWRKCRCRGEKSSRWRLWWCCQSFLFQHGPSSRPRFANGHGAAFVTLTVRWMLGDCVLNNATSTITVN